MTFVVVDMVMRFTKDYKGLYRIYIGLQAAKNLISPCKADAVEEVVVVVVVVVVVMILAATVVVVVVPARLT